MRNSNGFGALQGILVLIILALVVWVGWQVSTTNNQTPTLDNIGQSTDTPSPNPADETASWRSFSPNNKRYTIKLPDGWSFFHQDDDCDCLYAQTMEYEPGTPASISTTKGGRDGIFGFFIIDDDSDISSERFMNFTELGSFQAGELTGTKYYYEQKTDPQGIGIPLGAKKYAYYFVKNGRGIYITYTLLPGESNKLELAEKSIKTLR